MGIKFNNVMQLFSNMRTRSIIIITGALLFLIVILGIIGIFRANNAAEASALAKLSTVRQIEATPGLQQVTPEYAKIQQQLNQQNYEKAIKNKTSAIPTLIGIDEGQETAGFGSAGANGAAGANGTAGAAGMNGTNGVQGDGSGLGEQTGTNSSISGQVGVNGAAGGQNGVNGAAGGQGAANGGAGANSQGSLQEQQLRAQLAALQQQQALAANPAMQQQLQRTQQAMQNQAQQLITSWSSKAGTATQVYIASPTNVTKTPAEIEKQREAAQAQEAQAPIIKAGDIVFAVLNTGVNSDEPGPILATILSGPLKGGKLVGSLQKTADLPGTNGPTKVILSFNMMSLPQAPASVPVNAVAIDPDTARTALASDVDHHYLSRYGSVFAAAFLQGWGNAIQQSGTQVLVGPLGNTTITAGSLTGVQELAAGFGQVGQQWGSQLNDALDRQNTIYVNAGISIGILFLGDVSLNSGNYGGPTLQQPAPLNTNMPANTNAQAENITYSASTALSTNQPGAVSNSTGSSLGAMAPAPATPFQNGTATSNIVQSRRIAPGVQQQWGPVYPMYTQTLRTQ